VRKIMLGVLGAIAITIVVQGTTFAAPYDAAIMTMHQFVSTTTTITTTTGDGNGSNQNHSQDQ
jgi:hypothetical protein